MTATMKKTLAAVSRVEKSKVDSDIRVCRRIEVGHVAAHQGDIYVWRVADDHPRGAKIGTGSVQLAQGTSNGARHVAEGPVTVFAGSTLPKAVTPPMGAEASEIAGPVIVADGPWMLTHPEHPHHDIRPAGVYMVTHQWDPKTMRRVVD